ncbi:nucleotide-binding domain-containing protein [Achlya hypogyna]|uniref:NADH:ubiquinone reductase (non-electrogenic) n=1 Tax=Achlya hypogyna TaxID=1202772 RepID=A0A0A7CN05_ACHHY|nr:secreted protein [Achlya hypogyna]OQR92795.1 nucleotide-binding domain-containing protein [Achlya hypogyna]
MQSLLTRRVAPALLLASATTAVAWSEAPKPISKEAPKHIVVLGSGWGAVAFLRNLKPDNDTRVTVVSPRGVFLYTPLLPAASTGAVEARSIVEPIQTFLPNNARFVEAAATSIDPLTNRVTCVSELDPTMPFSLEYDQLVVAVGSVANTFGTPGVYEHAHFLKTYEDVVGLRRLVHARWEQAALPTTSPEEQQRLLSFTICGGGPTGVELAAEIQDLFQHDLKKHYPTLAPLATVRVIDCSSQILSMFDRKIAAYATAAFAKNGIETLLKCRVTGVNADSVEVLDTVSGTKRTLPSGTTMWCSGIGFHPLAASLATLFPEHQTNKRAVVVDPYFRVKGSSNIFCLGDAAAVTYEQSVAHAAELFDQFDSKKQGGLTVDDIRDLFEHASKKFPQFREHVHLIEESQHISKFARPFAHGAIHAIFEAADADKNDILDKDEFVVLLKAMDAHLRSLPATAQVAQQQGEYLAQLFNKKQHKDPTRAAPFEWNNLGSMAFIGEHEAVASIPGAGVLQGYLMGLMWRGFETMKQQSYRSHFAVATDNIRTAIFGRGL